MFANLGHIFYDVTFEGPLGVLSENAQFNRVEFKNNGNIGGNNTIKDLIFTAGKTYTLGQASTQTITNLFSANTPECGGWSTITSSTPGAHAKIVATADVMIDVSGVIMKDINASGGANFSALNSIDNGNNTGWTFPANTGQNLYWVGGSGNWSDKAHWSKTSGGSGGYCVPGPADNTFFDNGSGFTASSKTVTVDNISYTHDITFSGSATAPALKQNSTDQILNIYGSSEWQAGMGTIEVNTIIYRHTGEAKTIKSNGVKMGLNTGFLRTSSVIFEEENSLSLLDDFYVEYMHRKGNFVK